MKSSSISAENGPGWLYVVSLAIYNLFRAVHALGRERLNRDSGIMKSSPGTFPAKRSTPCRCFKSTSIKPLLRKVSRTQVLRHPHTGTRTRTRTKVNFDPVAWDVCLGNALRSIPPQAPRSIPPQAPRSIPPVQYPRSIPY